MTDYKPQSLDQKWQQQWTSAGAFEVEIDKSRPKFYCLEMFAYPSGHAHVGHVRNYIIGDVSARMKRMRGFNVLHPFGWDAFGLPAENAAIKTGTHPETSTLDNIAHMKGQLQRLGISYAWNREIATCLPDYYKFNQWIFLKMFERGLAYRRRSTVNWCPSCNTVLANEQVIDGACWRCGTTVVPRDLEQWFFRITAYADELLKGLQTLTEWPEKVVVMQRNWIGRSEGARIKFPVVGAEPIEVFTTRIDTIYGATFVLLAPEHPMVERFAAESPDPQAFRERVRKFKALDREGRLTGAIEKEGFDTGRTAKNPFTGEEVPIWIANFVLAEYGSGAIMAVPAHDERDFEFARKYHLPIRIVVQSDGTPASADELKAPSTNYGKVVNSGEWNGQEAPAVITRMIADAERRGSAKARSSIGSRTGASPGSVTGARRFRSSTARRTASSPCRTTDLPVELPKVTDVHRTRRFAARAGPRMGERHVSEVRRSGHA